MTGAGNSFNPRVETKMKYNEFLEKVNKNSFSVAMKDNRVGLGELRDAITEPKFFLDISHLEGIDVL